jgi:hypothetical protein
MKTQIFHHAKIYIIFKKSSEKNPKSIKILGFRVYFTMQKFTLAKKQPIWGLPNLI